MLATALAAVALPAVSCGVFGYPLADAARIRRPETLPLKKYAFADGEGTCKIYIEFGAGELRARGYDFVLVSHLDGGSGALGRRRGQGAGLRTRRDTVRLL